ncbi:MAG: aminopeptidase [Clostridiales bacterium]|uniref:aminopeptidase n=1 Tax=Clostridium sp. N3C TaxID=1776758 RepID=UPI00092E197A|nr:aminopeptidase [Clostridium sp. N3C]NLZ49425.1 aminopeptidase [Clostridiales bacterium]SCN25194.1 Aminopeptidase 2 [Clostridium sp. N3C]
MSDSRLDKLAALLVNYSARVKPGDFVYIECDEVALPWMKAVAREAVKAGGHVEYKLTSEDVGEVLLKYASEEQLKEESFMKKNVLERADVWLTAWGGRNTRTSTNIPSEKLKASLQGASSWRKVYSERMGNGSLRWCGTMFPTHAEAQEASMSLSDYEDFVYGAGLLDAEDPVAEWKRISAEQDRWIKYLNSKKEIHFVSEGTDIKARIEGRKWINCDGRVNFPDGEIFTSPIEDSVEGYVTFSYPSIYMGQAVEGIRLEVKKGKVVKAEAKGGEELLKSLLATDEGASYFGEVAIGTNYGIKKFTRNILFDEKIGGTFHMAIGDSFPEAGGKNKSSLHWDMICDMRNGGKIYADGELFYENGQFIKEVLEKYGL